MRTIDADALKEEVNKKKVAGRFNTLLLIDNAPTVPLDEWIPVSERLPEHSYQPYLVTVDYGDGLVCSCQRYFFSEEIGWNDDCVIAWMPLPEPYKGDMKGGDEE